MFKRIGTIFSICLILFGCQTKSDYDQVSKFHDDGRAKPVVALVPVFDRSGAEVGWSLSEEFTDQLRSRFLKRNNFCLSTSGEINRTALNLSTTQNPFGNDIDWVKQAFNEYEFVIFAELAEHDIHSKPLKGNFLDKLTPSSELAMTMRVRVFDLRGAKPEVILQEFVQQSHVIPKPSHINEPSPDRWKKVTFLVSPLGLAHAQFTKEVVNRIEDYILLSKSQ